MAELTRRYIVMPMSAEGPFDPRDPEASFVLKPWKDPAALAALETYRDSCYQELARDITAWVTAIRSGPVIRGSVGARNESFLASRPCAARAATPRRRRAKVKSKQKTSKSLRKKTKRR